MDAFLYYFLLLFYKLRIKKKIKRLQQKKKKYVYNSTEQVNMVTKLVFWARKEEAQKFHL